jgi:5-methylcytosine-specific restriction enzyme subunit McrC
MLPFLVNMPKLYEMFIAEWLKENLSDNINIRTQENVQIGEYGELNLRILLDKNTMNPIAVMDTKYKNPDTPSQSDINQIATYALSLNVGKAILVYPSHLKKPFKWNAQGIIVQSYSFDIGENLENVGVIFLKSIFMELLIRSVCFQRISSCPSNSSNLLSFSPSIIIQN